METLFFTNPACRLHEMGAQHPESPQRLDAIADQLTANGLIDFLAQEHGRMASVEEILRVHSSDYLQSLQQALPASGYHALDGDTLMNQHSLEAAFAAAGAGLSAVQAVLEGPDKTAFCAVRPPGHHARPTHAMGFCLFNNIAIAARHALEHYGLQRVAIIDFDVHHGNGTEEIFLAEERVLMCSYYQHPFYPHMRAEHPGKNMVNIPVAAYADGEVIRALVKQYWLPALHAFKPQLMLVSAGFDGHREDDMGSLKLVEADFAWITKQLVDVANQHCQGKIVSFLEGGYDLSALGRSVVAHIRALGDY